MAPVRLARLLPAALLLAGCAALPLPLPAGSEPGAPAARIAGPLPTDAALTRPALTFEAPEAAAAPDVAEPPLPGHGHVVIRIKWPDRTAQVIPDGTKLIRITAASKAATYDKNLDFTSGSSKGTFKNAPAGALTLSAFAYDTISPGLTTQPLASASADLTIQSGGIIAAKLVLNSGAQPTVTTMRPTVGGEKAQIELLGTNFGSGTDVLKVYVDGKEVASAGIFRTSISQAFFQVPAWATRSAVAVSVIRGNSTQSADVSGNLTRLKSLVLASTSFAITVGATASVAVSGIDVFDTATSSVQAQWFAASGGDHATHEHAGDECMCLPGLTVDVLGVLTANAAGSYHVMARNGILLATGSVTVP